MSRKKNFEIIFPCFSVFVINFLGWTHNFESCNCDNVLVEDVSENRASPSTHTRLVVSFSFSDVLYMPQFNGNGRSGTATVLQRINLLFPVYVPLAYSYLDTQNRQELGEARYVTMP